MKTFNEFLSEAKYDYLHGKAWSVERLHEFGFDTAKEMPNVGRNAFWATCSQCDAMVINGTPTHERGCRNQTYPCKECDFGRTQRRGGVCEGCSAAD